MAERQLADHRETEMTANPRFPRIGRIAWLFVQAAPVVGGILLAFAIDAWWGQRTEVQEKNSLLQSVKEEFLEELAWAEREQKYRHASKKSAKALLAACAAGSYTDPDKSLDQRLADLTWLSIVPKSATLEGFMSGGYLAAVKDEKLRHALIVRRSRFESMSWMSVREYTSFDEMVMPFLTKHASVAQLSNVVAKDGMPGLSGYRAAPKEILPIAAEIDHSALLHNQEFAGIVVRKLWLHVDMLTALPGFIEEAKELVRLIDDELDEAK